MSRDIKTLPISRIAVSKLLKAGYSTADFLQYVDKANLEKGWLGIIHIMHIQNFGTILWKDSSLY